MIERNNLNKNVLKANFNILRTGHKVIEKIDCGHLHCI